MPKQIIVRLNLKELSNVDNPAQPHAKALLVKRFEPKPTGGDPMPKSVEELQKALDDQKAANDKVVKDAADAHQLELDKVQKQLDATQFLAGLTDVEKAHYGELDDDGKEKFSKLTADQRADLIKNKSADDEVVVYKSAEIRKSVVGATQFLIFKSMAEDLEKQSSDIKDANDRAALATLAKRAEIEYPNLPGTSDEKAALLKAIAILPEKDKLEALFKAADTAMIKLTVPSGGQGVVGDATQKLAALTKNYMTENNVDEPTAMGKVLNTPEGSALYAQSVQ